MGGTIGLHCGAIILLVRLCVSCRISSSCSLLTFGETFHVFPFGVSAGSKEHRVDVESEDSKRGGAVIGILGTVEGHGISPL